MVHFGYKIEDNRLEQMLYAIICKLFGLLDNINIHMKLWTSFIS